MSEEPWTPEPSPEPDPARESRYEPREDSPPPAKPAGRKRRAVQAIIALYALSLVASGVLLWRSKSAPKEADAAAVGESGAVKKLSKSILSAGKDKQYVAVVNITGAIYRGDGRRWGRGAVSWRKKIEKLAAKDEVKAIVLAINSPGGSVGSVQEIYSSIQRIKRETGKPFVAQLGDVAASGGYYLAAACDKVVAHPGTLLGSIGVIFSNTNVEGLLQKVGIKSRAIKSGKMKDIGSMARPMTAEERMLLQALIDNAYGQFLTAVADGRGMSKEEVRPHADGRIFTGEQALDIRLVDKLGDFHDAVAWAGELGGIQGKPEILPEGDSFSSLMELLESRLSVLLEPRWSALREVGLIGRAGLEYRWSY
jgi:protease-4